MKPDVLELAGIFRLKLNVCFDKFFKEIALLLFGQVTPPVLEDLPRGASMNRST